MLNVQMINMKRLKKELIILSRGLPVSLAKFRSRIRGIKLDPLPDLDRTLFDSHICRVFDS